MITLFLFMSVIPLIFLEEDMNDKIIRYGKGIHFEHDESITGATHCSCLEILKLDYMKEVMPAGRRP